MTHYRSSPRSLGFALHSLRDELAPDTLLAAVQRAWPAAVGEMIAAEAAPSAERAGVITISCSAAVWAQELDLMGTELLRRLNHTLGSERVVRLRCIAV